MSSGVCFDCPMLARDRQPCPCVSVTDPYCDFYLIRSRLSEMGFPPDGVAEQWISNVVAVLVEKGLDPYTVREHFVDNLLRFVSRRKGKTPVQEFEDELYQCVARAVINHLLKTAIENALAPFFYFGKAGKALHSRPS